MFSNILSIIAILISIGVPLFEHFSNRRINNINIDSHYYTVVYEKYLLIDIPENRMRIERLRSGKVEGREEFLEMLRNIRKKSLCLNL